MGRADVDDGRDVFFDWYSDLARRWIGRRVEEMKGRIGVEPSGFDIRDLGFRWGSCGKSGRLFFHWATILLPVRIVEYVVVHELVHLREPNHTPDFWRRVERAMPDYDDRKSWLAEHGGRYVKL